MWVGGAVCLSPEQTHMPHLRVSGRWVRAAHPHAEAEAPTFRAAGGDSTDAAEAQALLSWAGRRGTGSSVVPGALRLINTDKYVNSCNCNSVLFHNTQQLR